ncbi:MAG: nitroreductase family deazaflavin-dependent oxidoreductase [Myxococcota bacterium]
MPPPSVAKKAKKDTPSPVGAHPFLTPRQERVAEAVLRLISRLNVSLFRLSRGRMGGRWLRGAPVLLLTTIGRKSGQRRTAPVLYLDDPPDLVVVASKGGMRRHPLWYRNLEANPHVEVELPGERRRMRARLATEEEKSRLWPRLVEMYPDFQAYQDRTRRRIPVVVLSPQELG